MTSSGKPLVNSAADSSLVSVGLPVYNGARFLPRALDSLLAQDWSALEILVSDNGSTDDTVAIAEAFARRDSRVCVMRSPVNQGVEKNFARVLGAARGGYFMWAACDDWWGPTFVPRLVAALERTPGAVVAMSAVERVDESGEVLDVVRYSGAEDPSRLSSWQITMRLAGGRPHHLFIYGLHRADFLKRAFTGFAPVVASDRLFMCRIAMGGRFAYVDEILYRRLVRRAPIAERYSDEGVGRLWRGSAPRWRLALRAGPYLWSSAVLPPARRLWVPAVVARLLKASLGHTIVQSWRSSS